MIALQYVSTISNINNSLQLKNIEEINKTRTTRISSLRDTIEDLQKKAQPNYLILPMRTLHQGTQEKIRKKEVQNPTAS